MNTSKHFQGLSPRGNKGLPKSLSRGHPQGQGANPKVFTGSAVVVSMTGLSGIGWGTTRIGGLPEGNICFLGAVAYAIFDENGHANIIDTFDGDFSVGTTPADDGTLTAGDVDIIPSTAMTTAVAGVTPEDRATHAVAVTGTVYDNTAGDLELNLNVLIDDLSIDADAVPLLATYRLELSYVVLGDD